MKYIDELEDLMEYEKSVDNMIHLFLNKLKKLEEHKFNTEYFQQKYKQIISMLNDILISIQNLQAIEIDIIEKEKNK